MELWEVAVINKGKSGKVDVFMGKGSGPFEAMALSMMTLRASKTVMLIPLSVSRLVARWA